jgi:hypothetical protein
MRHVRICEQFVEQTPGAGVDHVPNGFPIDALK